MPPPSDCSVGLWKVNRNCHITVFSVCVPVRLFPAHRARADHFEAVLITTSLGSFLLCGRAGGGVLRYLSQLSMNFLPLSDPHTLHNIGKHAYTHPHE